MKHVYTKDGYSITFFAMRGDGDEYVFRAENVVRNEGESPVHIDFKTSKRAEAFLDEGWKLEGLE